METDDDNAVALSFLFVELVLSMIDFGQRIIRRCVSVLIVLVDLCSSAACSASAFDPSLPKCRTSSGSRCLRKTVDFYKISDSIPTYFGPISGRFLSWSVSICCGSDCVKMPNIIREPLFKEDSWLYKSSDSIPTYTGPISGSFLGWGVRRMPNIFRVT